MVVIRGAARARVQIFFNDKKSCKKTGIFGVPPMGRLGVPLGFPKQTFGRKCKKLDLRGRQRHHTSLFTPIGEEAPV